MQVKAPPPPQISERTLKKRGWQRLAGARHVANTGHMSQTEQNSIKQPTRAEGQPAGDPFNPPGAQFRPVSMRLWKARLAGALIVPAIALIAAIVTAVITKSIVAWIVVAAVIAFGIWLTWLIPRQVRAIGWAVTNEELLIRRGIMFKSLCAVPYGRMQFVDVKEGPLDRWMGIASVELHTASATTDADIPGLPKEDANLLRDRLSALGNAEMAGL